MPRLDVYPTPGTSPAGKGAKGYVLDVQADLLSHLDSRTVVPLLPIESAPKPIGELNQVFEVLGKHYVMTTQAIASIPLRELKHPVASLADQRDLITRALDFLLIGF